MRPFFINNTLGLAFLISDVRSKLNKLISGFGYIAEVNLQSKCV